MGKKRRRGQVDWESSKLAKTQHADNDTIQATLHYSSISSVPWDLQHYWRQRYRIFSRYDEGILMTEDAWYGVTQEAVGAKIAEDIAAIAPKDKSIIIDAFCGVGGNTIALALSGRWKRVYAIEKDLATLECARQNAKIYGVYEKITFFHGDCFEILATSDKKTTNTVEALQQVIAEYGVIFASPPWGGPGYKTHEVFDLSSMEPYNLHQIHERLAGVTKIMALYLPRTSDIKQIAGIVEDGQQAQIVHYCTDGSSRALCAYLGDWSRLEAAS